MAMHLTAADHKAITRKDGAFFCVKGAEADFRGDCEQASEYYRLGMLFGDADSCSNLALCYEYGKGVPKSLSLALAYFEHAAKMGSLDAICMMARRYRSGEDGTPKDPDMAAFYYHWGEELGKKDPDKLKYCPFLCLDLGKEKMPEGLLFTDLKDAYRYLILAKEGFQREVEQGMDNLQQYADQADSMMHDPVFYPMLGIQPEEASEEDDDEDDFLSTVGFNPARRRQETPPAGKTPTA